MPFDPHDFLNLAKVLCEEGRLLGDESRLRTSISRAYYAAYWLVCEVIRRERRAARLYIGHERLANDLKASGDNDLQQLGQRLDALRSARSDADYWIHKQPNAMTAGLMVRDASHIIDKLPTLSASSLNTSFRG